MAFATLIPRARARHSLSHARDVDRLFEEFFGGRFGPTAASPSGRIPRVLVSESDEAYRVTAELPGLGEKDVEVVLEDGTLTIRAAQSEEKEGAQAGEGRVASRFGSFERRVRIEAAVEEEQVVASLKNGVLTVTLPKPAEAQSRQIPVTLA